MLGCGVREGIWTGTGLLIGSIFIIWRMIKEKREEKEWMRRKQKDKEDKERMGRRNKGKLEHKRR